MKNIILILSSFLFSLLFYKQNIGLNLFLFSLISTGILAFFNVKKFKETETLLKATVYIVVSVLVFVHHSFLTIFSSIICFIILVGTVSEHRSSIYLKFLNGLYTTIVAAFSHYFDRKKTSESEEKSKKTDYIFLVKIILIPLIIIILFISLYKNANPVFENLINKIDFSFINISWLLFTGLGYYLFYNISQPILIEPSTQIDLNIGNILEKQKLKKIQIEVIQKETKLGVVLMISLNLLLVFLIFTDIFYLNQQQGTISSTELKTQLHQSVNSLITSIILAISIIIYFFRGNINFYKQNTLLKNTTFIWIILNSVLALITAYKNYQYIASYGITYKRIGVYVYLFLAFSGLVFTFIKVKNVKNIWFLFRKNFQVSFAVLILASFINWDIFITKYNLNHQNKNLPYLLSLSSKNAKLLNNYVLKNEDISTELKDQIHNKYYKYTSNLSENNWQEMVLENFRKEN